MTVLHALAITGSTDVTGADQWKAFEMAREQERVSKAKERLARLMARRSVLLEERDAKLPAALADAATREVFAAELRVRQLECLTKINHDEALRELITATEGELRILQERLAALETNLAEKVARVSELASLRARGTTTDANYYLTRSELGLTQDHWHEVRTVIAQVSRHLSELRIQQSQSAIEFELARERDIASADKAIAEDELTTKIMGTLTLQATATQGEKHSALQLRLIRRTVNGAEQTIVNNAALLEPGDIISVDRVALPEMSANKVFKDPAVPRM